VCEAFSLLSLVTEKIYCKVRQLKYFRWSSRAGTLQEKYWEFRKSLTRFGALMCVEHLGQVSFKSDKFRYPKNSFELREYAKKETRVLGTERFRHFSHLIKAVFSVVVPPTNRTQRRNPLMSVSTKRSMKFVGKGEPEHNIYFIFGLGFLIMTLKNRGLLDRQENEA